MSVHITKPYINRPLANSQLTSLQVMCHAESSNKDPLLFDIYSSTEAIFFLGTPHRGSNQADTAEIIRRIVSASGFDASDQNIRALQVNSAELERIHVYFMKLYEQQDQYPLKVVTFQEGKGFTGINYLGLNKRVGYRHRSFQGESSWPSVDSRAFLVLNYWHRANIHDQRKPYVDVSIQEQSGWRVQANCRRDKDSHVWDSEEIGTGDSWNKQRTCRYGGLLPQPDNGFDRILYVTAWFYQEWAE